MKKSLQLEENMRGEAKIKRRRNNINVSDEGFIEKATQLINLIPPEMLAEEELSRFKKMSKEWVKSNINPKPY